MSAAPERLPAESGRPNGMGAHPTDLTPRAVAPSPKRGLLARLFGGPHQPQLPQAPQSPPEPGVQYGNGGCYRDSSYAGASRMRKQLNNWQPVRAAADADLLPDYDLLVARSRDLDRNNGVAAGAFQTLQDNTVGVGLRLSCWPDYRALGRDISWAEDWSRNVESLWRTWSESCACDAAGRQTFASMTQLMFRSTLQNGEALALPLWLERNETQFRTCLQLVETDRLSNPGNMMPTTQMRGGVETDEYGRPQAYYIRKMSTWIGMLFPAYMGIAAEWERIPAETSWGRKRVIHCMAQERVDQTRGKPILSPVIEQFRMLDSYQRTELQSSIVNSLVAGVIETPLDPAGIAEMMGGDANQYLATKGEYRIQLEGGTFIPLYPGDKMTPFTPARPAPQFSNFVEAVLRQIGTAIGLPYELVQKDFSKTNYSSARAALLEAWRFFINRRTWLATYWCGPIYRLWLEEAVNAGMIEAPDFYTNLAYYARAKWIGPGRGWIDPVKEAEAAQIRMASMISTLEMECAEQGLDYNDVLEQRALEIQRMKELDLYIPPVPPTKPESVPETPEPVPVREPV
jgi:lambda family phage portal protein